MKFIKIESVTGIGLLFFLCFQINMLLADAPEEQQYYQLKIYHYNSPDQRALLEDFLKKAYLPALHRNGITRVGVFYPALEVTQEEEVQDSLIYVLIPYATLDQFAQVEEILLQDNQFKEKGKEYLDAAFDNPPYSRLESILMHAFSTKPTIAVPDLKAPATKRIYELRSYEAATEKLHLNKVRMFNSGETAIFDRLGFNPVFYARVLAGRHMPNLMYMTSFESFEEREAHWKAFREDPAWKKLSADPQYAHNFLKADVVFLHPTAYSDL